MSTLRVDNLRGQTAGTNRYVVQVVSETITAQLNGSVGSAGTYIDTGVTATITPTSTSNTISCRQQSLHPHPKLEDYQYRPHHIQYLHPG